jgi:RNA polymerase primary sigma factor
LKEELPKEFNDLLETGKEKGYLTYDEINETLSDDLATPEELDELYQTMSNLGIELIEDAGKLNVTEEGGTEQEKASSPALPTRADGMFNLSSESKREESGYEIDLTPSVLDRTNDPVRMYLKEMGNVPLLTRQKEVVLSKKIEHGKKITFKALSRFRFLLPEILEMGRNLRELPEDAKSTLDLRDDDEDNTKARKHMLDIFQQLEDSEVKITEFEARINRLKKKDTPTYANAMRHCPGSALSVLA